MKAFKIALILILIVIFSDVSAQSRIRRSNNFSSYKDRINEIGYITGVAYQQNENAFAPQMHLHFTHLVTDFFFVGFGYSGIYDKHFHNSVALEMGFRFVPEIYVSVKPGVMIKNFHSELDVLYSLGLEAGYEFKINETMHIGPSLQVDLSQDEVVYILGFHMGLPF